MATFYADSSVLVKRHVPETGTPSRTDRPTDPGRTAGPSPLATQAGMTHWNDRS